VYNNKHKPKRGRNVHPVMTLEFQETIKDVCYSKSDLWANTVLGRLEFACDLPAVEARYHQNWCSNFRSGYQVPKHFVGQLKFDNDLIETCSEAKVDQFMSVLKMLLSRCCLILRIICLVS